MLNDNIKAFIQRGGYITDLAIIWREQLVMTANTWLGSATQKDEVKEMLGFDFSNLISIMCIK